MTEQKTHKRVNRFSGESVMLTREEAKKHDAIFYYEYMATEEDKKLGWGGSKLWDKCRTQTQNTYPPMCVAMSCDKMSQGNRGTKPNAKFAIF